MNHELPSRVEEETELDPEPVRLILPINGSGNHNFEMDGKRVLFIGLVNGEHSGNLRGEFIAFDLTRFKVIEATGFLGESGDTQRELLRKTGHTILETAEDGRFIGYKKLEDLS